jgi:protein-tyrosine-phosphatase
VATSFTNSTRFEILNKSNYDTWKIQVEALLIKNDTSSCASGEKPKPQVTGEGEARAVTEEEQKKSISADRKAKSDLILAMNASEHRQIRSCETSRKIWMELESIYESKGPARKATLLKQLIQHKMREDDDVREHVAKLMDTVGKLQGMNIEINSSFENFRCPIESRDSLPNVENLKVKIVEENDARNQKLDGSSTGGVMFSKHFSRDSNSSKNNYKKQDEKSSKPKITCKCNYCGKRGVVTRLLIASKGREKKTKRLDLSMKLTIRVKLTINGVWTADVHHTFATTGSRSSIHKKLNAS